MKTHLTFKLVFRYRIVSVVVKLLSIRGAPLSLSRPSITNLNGDKMVHLQGRATASPPPLLEVEKLSVRFGGVQALTNVNLEVRAGEICGLIGPNGAGKTTLFNCITRMYDVSAGSVKFEGRRIDMLPTHRIIAAGIARTFQNLGVYGRMTVLENVMLGAHHTCGQSVLRAWLRPAHSERSERELADWCRSILADIGLERVADAPAASLPYPALKRVEIARTRCTPSPAVARRAGGRPDPWRSDGVRGVDPTHSSDP